MEDRGLVEVNIRLDEYISEMSFDERQYRFRLEFANTLTDAKAERVIQFRSIFDPDEVPLMIDSLAEQLKAVFEEVV